VPVTTTEVAFVAATVKVDALPAVIVKGLEVRVTVGAGGGVAAVTVTTAVPDAVPPVPVAWAV
jgi:hypothetical protein